MMASPIIFKQFVVKEMPRMAIKKLLTDRHSAFRFPFKESREVDRGWGREGGA